MKKWIALILALVMVLGMVGCGGSTKEPEPTKQPEPTKEPATTPNTTETSTSEEQAGGYMEGIIIKILSDKCFVKINKEVIVCTIRGNFRNMQLLPLVGDKVIIESAIEEQTDLLVATSITVE